jgi:hypothetical protein
MKKIVAVLFCIVLFSCEKYERVNPLDPQYSEGSNSMESVELNYFSYRLVQQTDEPDNYIFDLYITIKNSGTLSSGSSANRVSGTISTSDANILVALGDTKDFGTSSSGYEIAANQTIENGFSYLLKVSKTISNNHEGTFSLTITDSETNKTWSEQFTIIINI